jgi:type IX secretion system PorP/SprF family membrane protein
VAGVQLVGDRAGQGIYSTYTVVGVYSYQANVSDNFAFKFGLHGGFGQKRLDMSKVYFYDQINPVTGFTDPGNNPNPTAEPGVNASLIHAELGAGILAYSRVFYAGASARHINNPVETFRNDYSARLPIRFSGHLGAAIPMGGRGSDVTLSPNLLYTQQASFKQLNTGMYLKAGYVFGGVWARYDLSTVDAVILLVGAEIGILRAGYSYDLTLSDLRGHSGGAHELGITINLEDLPGNQNRPSSRFLRCPAVF